MNSSYTLKPPLHSPDPDTFDHSRFRECLRTAHDLGGEADGPMSFGAASPQEIERKQWELNTYVICECLAWRGVWNHTEKLRRVVDLGQTQYFALPYYGRFLLSAARAMVDKQHVTITELTNKIDEVKRRYEQK